MRRNTDVTAELYFHHFGIRFSYFERLCLCLRLRSLRQITEHVEVNVNSTEGRTGRRSVRHIKLQILNIAFCSDVWALLTLQKSQNYSSVFARRVGNVWWQRKLLVGRYCCVLQFSQLQKYKNCLFKHSSKFVSSGLIHGHHSIHYEDTEVRYTPYIANNNRKK
jgi:hypothetical protein